MPASPLRDRWSLDPDVVYLNHGSFGACPRSVMRAQTEVRAELERQPVRFMQELEERLDVARSALAAFVDADAEGLAFVPNATTGVATVLASLDLRPSEEVLTTDHAYGACRNALDHAAERAGARVVVAAVPFPLASEDVVVERVLAAVTKHTRLALLDHVTSPTGLVLPIERLVRELALRGVETLVDGAHAPGMLALSVDAVGAAYYTGNLHKWVCAPKGAAFLAVREDLRAKMRPLVLSHGASSPRRDRSRYRLEFDWTGTHDPSAFLAVPDAIRFVSALMPGGLAALIERNRALALAARSLLCEALDVAEPAPASMVGSLAAVPLPDAIARPTPPLYLDPLQIELRRRDRIEVPISFWPAWPHRNIRVSAAAYNEIADYELLARALRRGR
jgi:isopenicillin-N epimerase